MPIVIHLPGKANPLHGFTHTVSASGAMIILPEGLSQGTKLAIENPKTQKKVEAHVVRPPQMNPEGSLIPVEFDGAFAAVLEYILPTDGGQLERTRNYASLDQSTEQLTKPNDIRRSPTARE